MKKKNHTSTNEITRIAKNEIIEHREKIRVAKDIEKDSPLNKSYFSSLVATPAWGISIVDFGW